jgi:hypothetical protein
MAYHPFFPIQDLFQLICGVLMIIPACFAFKKVSKSSKNIFAYVLLGFTVLLGIAYVGTAFCEAFRREVILPDRPHYFANEYTSQIFFYLQYISALQGWIFCVCYLKSATASSIKDSCLTEKKITVTGWIIGGLFVVCQTGTLVVLLATFPGYYDRNG